MSNHINQKGFVNIAVVIGVIIVAGGAGYFLLIKKPLPVVPQPSPATSTSQLPTPTPPVTTSTPTKTPVTQTPLLPKDTTVNKQGIFGTVSMHTYGCGQPPPDGSGCDMKDVNEVVGEGEKVTVNVADKIDSYGNVNSQHTIATYYTDQKGAYKAYLNTGKYIMCVRDRDCSNMITVESGKFTEVNLSIDMPRP